MRSGFVMLGLAGLISAAAAAQSTAPDPVTLPMPAESKIAVPLAAAIDPFADNLQIADISKTLHFRIAEEGLANLQIRSATAPANPNGAMPLALAAPPVHSEATLTWDFAKWGSLGLTTENSRGAAGGLLGDFSPRPMSFTDESRNADIGLAAHIGLGDGWVTSFSYHAGVSQLDLRAGASPALASTSAHGRSYGLSIAKRGVFGDADALGLSVTRPSDNYFGSISLAGVGLEDRGSLLQQYPGVAFGNGARETDIALGYVTTFFNGALALQANAGYQMNAGGQSGTNSVAVVSRAKINF